MPEVDGKSVIFVSFSKLAMKSGDHFISAEPATDITRLSELSAHEIDNTNDFDVAVHNGLYGMVYYKQWSCFQYLCWDSYLEDEVNTHNLVSAHFWARLCIVLTLW